MLEYFSATSQKSCFQYTNKKLTKNVIHSIHWTYVYTLYLLHSSFKIADNLHFLVKYPCCGRPFVGTASSYFGEEGGEEDVDVEVEGLMN